MVSLVAPLNRDAYADQWHAATRALATDRTREIAATLASLELDPDAQNAALLLDVAPTQLTDPALAKTIDRTVISLAIGAQRMAMFHEMTITERRDAATQAAQLESLRKMLLAMVEDVRVVLIKLAERLVVLRALSQIKTSDDARTAAIQVRDLFAPLANRLGIWQLKWELEDLSLRILEPVVYKDIAKALDARKADRDRYIESVIGQLTQTLSAAGIVADVKGRAKHITSIWNKMQRKGYRIDELYDIRAVRVLVPEIKDCYATLGVVHHSFTPISSEFDDYIARPKANNYRSLHTAVVGPEGLALEVQIRTHDMHRASEYGVAAHWRYKEGGFEKGSGKRDADFESKLAWLRQVMDWRETAGSASDVVDALKTNLFEESIFVFTPQGRVVDLPKGATAVDFAYHVHTTLGHRCRGARVDGAMVQLNTPLQNGQRVEVMTVKEGGPSRDWLNSELGYLQSQRAKSKVRAWFNALAHDETVSQGRAEVERALQRDGKTTLSLEALAKAGAFANTDALFEAVAKARVNQRELAAMIHQAAGDAMPAGAAPAIEPKKSRAGGDSGILIVGMDGMLTTLARCCLPAPPDAIVGFVTRGAGVTIHRESCANVRRLRTQHSERLLVADWGRHHDQVMFAVRIEVLAEDRAGVVRDVLDALAKERVNVSASNATAKKHRVTMRLSADVKDKAQLTRALALVQDVAGVSGARRV